MSRAEPTAKGAETQTKGSLKSQINFELTDVVASEAMRSKQDVVTAAFPSWEFASPYSQV